MTREEAIYLLVNATYSEEWQGNEDLQTAQHMAIEALQKQIPQQPTIERGFVKCPACKLFIRYPIIDRYNNCPECGQALKWGGDEE